MTLENAQELKQKIDMISAAAQEYSDSAKLFDAAKDNISTLTNSNVQQSEKMQKLISECDEYLLSAKNLIDTEYTNQLETVTLKAREVIDKNGEKCQEVVDSANSMQKEIEYKLNEFANRLSILEKKNQRFSYIGIALSGVIIILLILGFFI